MELTIRKSESLDDWYLIERAEHDGRQWMEPMRGGGAALRCSARLGNADVEGHAAEMLAIAEAILKREAVNFRRCAVDARSEPVAFWSPRNSTDRGPGVPYGEADRLAVKINEILKVV